MSEIGSYGSLGSTPPACGVSVGSDEAAAILDAENVSPDVICTHSYDTKSNGVRYQPNKLGKYTKMESDLGDDAHPDGTGIASGEIVFTTSVEGSIVEGSVTTSDAGASHPSSLAGSSLFSADMPVSAKEMMRQRLVASGNSAIQPVYSLGLDETLDGSMLWQCGSIKFNKQLGVYGHANAKYRMGLGDIIGCRVKGDTIEIIGYPNVRKMGCCKPRIKTKKRIRRSFRVRCTNDRAASEYRAGTMATLDLYRKLGPDEYSRTFDRKHRRQMSPLASPNSSTLGSEWSSRVTESERKMLVFINPRSGKRRALRIWRKTCKRVFDDAEIRVKEVVTERANHARDYLKQMPREALMSFECIVIVSGDGLMFEALQGIMARNDWRDVIRAVSFGIIHGGTGNGLACSICDESACVPTSALSAAFIIAKELKSPWTWQHSTWGAFPRHRSATFPSFLLHGDLLATSISRANQCDGWASRASSCSRYAT